GRAVAVGRGGVEVVDPEVDGTGDRPLALRRRAPDHEAADVPTAEAERGNTEPGTSQCAVLHQPISLVTRCARGRRKNRCTQLPRSRSAVNASTRFVLDESIVDE